MKMTSLLGFGNDVAKGTATLVDHRMKEHERRKKKPVTVLFVFNQTNAVTEPARGDFPHSWGAYLNRICCWLKWIGPISQLLITRSRGQMDESSERTLSLILSPLMCCGILGRRRGKKEDGRDRWPFWPSNAHTHTLSSMRHLGLLAMGGGGGGGTDFMVHRRMWSKTTERCRGGCCFSFTPHPAVGAAGCSCQRSACQTKLTKRGFDPRSLL